MKENPMLKDFYELTALEVYSKKERAICDVMKQKLADLGLEVEEDGTAEKTGSECGNIIAVLKGDPEIEPILFSCHLDRVPNNGHIQPQLNEEEMIMYSDKKTILAADDVSGICVMLQALRNVKEQNLMHGDIEVILSTCEEIGLYGADNADLTRFKAKMCFVFDIPGRAGRIVKQAPGMGKVVITVHGKKAHAGNEPEKGLNALRVCADLIMHLPDGRLSPFTTANFAMITGGPAANVVCDKVVLQGEHRSSELTEFNDTQDKIRAAVKEISEKYNTPIDLELTEMFKTFNIPEDAPACRIAAKACRNVGLVPFFDRGGGGMDGNVFNKNGITTIGIAPGYEKNHTADELLHVDDMFKCGEEATEIIKIVASGEY